MSCENYELTLENYYSLANHCCFECPNSHYSVHDKKNNMMSYYGYQRTLRWFNRDCSKIYMYDFKKAIIKNINSYKEFSLQFTASDDLSKMISSLSEVKEFDFEKVGEICDEFVKKFEGLHLLKTLWRGGKQVPANGWDMGGFLEIGKDKDSLDLNGSWRFYLKDHVFIFSEAGKLFIRYDLDGLKICEYSKYKELEAFL